MKKLTNFRMEVWTDGDEKKVSFHANLAGDGPKHFTFYFIQEQSFINFCTGKSDHEVDLSYNIRANGDSLVYYTFDLPNMESGKAQIPFAHINFPIRFRKVLLRLVKQLWAKYAESARISGSHMASKLNVMIDDKRLYRMEKSYSAGSGHVDVCEELRENVNQDDWKALKESEPDLVEKMGRIVKIAENTTRSYLQTAKVNFRLTYCQTCVDYAVTARFKHPIDGSYNERTITYGTIAKRDLAEDGNGHRWSTHS